MSNTLKIKVRRSKLKPFIKRDELPKDAYVLKPRKYQPKDKRIVAVYNKDVKRKKLKE